MTDKTQMDPKTAEPTNNQRATWAKAALDKFQAVTGDKDRPTGNDEIKTVMSDFLADYMHLADVLGVDILDALNGAFDNYHIEVGHAPKASAIL